ncbi:MAG: ImmA/IrrE family metallo-endopeptidase [Methanobrevibacter sp.]|jgi:Zn-dependent peptidase ImmA (M78 family)|nr:ImmA/IrrE family metallo-endopeptidase [Methanobrevibacter sp.]
MIDRLKLNSFAVELRHEWEINSLSPVNLLNTVLSRMPNLTILYYPMSDNTSGMCVKDIYDSSLELNIPNLNDLNADSNPGSEFSNLKDSDLNEDSSTDSDFESKISSDMLIGINSNMSIGRQNFTLAHELYHLLYEENKNNFVICDYSSESESEIEANIFASYLLIPYEGLKRYVKNMNISKWSLDDVIAAEQYYQISHMALLFRLVEQNFITEEESLEFQNVKISHEARIRGFNDDLYYPSPEDRKYFSLGNYVKSVGKAYSSNKISVGKKDELLLDGFRGDLTFKKK